MLMRRDSLIKAYVWCSASFARICASVEVIGLELLMLVFSSLVWW